ncbi:MAG: thioredoxin family protein [Hyphomicrobium sp.]|jgi:hypothetical protein
MTSAPDCTYMHRFARLVTLAWPMMLALLLPFGDAWSAEMIMFNQRGCPWCIRWQQEIGPIYPNSPEGRYAPLRVVDIRDTLVDVQLKKPVTITPTFVLVDKGQEIGRVTGYPGADFFWDLLSEIIPPQHQSRTPNKDTERNGGDAPVPQAIRAP